MPDRDKVFKAIRNCITVPKCRDCPWDECEKFDCLKVKVPVSLMLDALKLLKEQEPKAIEYYDNPFTGLPVAICPKCGKFARQFHTEHPGEETNYCPWCGQLLKWEEDDG